MYITAQKNDLHDINTESVLCNNTESVLTPTEVYSNIDTLPETDSSVIATTISAGISVNVTPVQSIDRV